MAAAKNLSGLSFGRLVVLDLAHRHNGHRYWVCLCSCGVHSTVTTGALLSGHTTSCGCFQREKQSDRAAKHGMHGYPEYWCWANMLQRCTNTKNRHYSDYGGRGVCVCESWSTFENFYKDMGPRPSAKHSIDRIDNNGNYCKENCRWATAIEQNNNQRKNTLLTYNGETRTLSQWAESRGIAYSALYGRLSRGWSIEDAIETPIRSKE